MSSKYSHLRQTACISLGKRLKSMTAVVNPKTLKYNFGNFHPAPLIHTATILRNCSPGRMGTHRYAEQVRGLGGQAARLCKTRTFRCTPRLTQCPNFAPSLTAREPPVPCEISKGCMVSQRPLSYFCSSSPLVKMLPVTPFSGCLSRRTPPEAASGLSAPSTPTISPLWRRL